MELFEIAVTKSERPDSSKAKVGILESNNLNGLLVHQNFNDVNASHVAINNSAIDSK